MPQQIIKGFFDSTPDRSRPHLASPPTDNDINRYLDGPDCPLRRVVVSKRNEPAMNQLRTFAFNALLRDDHSCRGMNFGFYCGPGQGKTHSIKAFAETIGIPLVFIQSDALESTWMLFELIAEAHKKAGWPMVPTKDDYHFEIPPCLVWFDEAQALSKDLRTGGLLNAMEYNDGWLRTQPPGKNPKQYTVDCYDVCWMASSTDPGDIYKESKAFYDRLSDHVIWHPAGPKEITQIVQNNFPELPYEACEMVAHYMRVPRGAIAFANNMCLQRRSDNCSWRESAQRVAKIKGIDAFGMLEKEITLLAILGQSPVSKSNLPNIIGVRKAELEEMLIPPLLDDQEGRGQLVRPTHKGFAITNAGLLELDKRKIKHAGDKVTAEYILGA